MNEGLTPLESVMWRIGEDPSLRMVVAQLMILDRPIARADLLQLLGTLADKTPRLKQLPREANGPRWRLRWSTDRSFDAGLHLRAMTAPSWGGMRHLLDIVGLVEPLPFDPERPPWDVTVIEGIEDGKSALLLRAHHALVGGFAATALVELLLDAGMSQGEDGRSGNGASSLNGAGNGRKPGTITIDLTRAVRPITNGFRASVAYGTVDAVLHGLQGRLEMISSVSRQMIATGGRLGSWPDLRSVGSRFDVLSIRDARGTSLRLGGSRNDLLVSAAASGIGDYLERMGDPSPALRVATPTVVLHGSARLQTWFAPLRTEVPSAAGVAGSQFGVVSERLARARSEPALRVMDTLAIGLSLLPPRILAGAVQAQADTVDFSATTLPGRRAPSHLCGAAVERSYAFGPRLGCPVNLTATGNEDRLDIGVALDPIAVGEPQVLLDCLERAFARFAAAVPVENPRSRPASWVAASSGRPA